jgi:hypothetical protein
MRNLHADACQGRPCRWCPQHQVAWLDAPFYGAPHWHPLPRGTLALALRWAEAGGCAGQITVIETACDRCEAAAQAS